MGLLFFYLFLALFVSFLCSIMESVLLSTPLAFLYSNEQLGKKWAKDFISLKNNIDKPLSAILSLNTVAHTVGAAGVGAQAIVVFGDAYFGLVSAILTILILVITEIIPKTIGASYSRRLAMTTTYTIKGMIFITYPLVLLSGFITKAITGNKEEKQTSREEISALTSIGAEEGIFNSKEHNIIQNILKLKSIKVTEIMTPRVVVETASEKMPVDSFLENKELMKFSRIPVYLDGEENITGYVLRQSVLENIAKDNHKLEMGTLKREIVVVPETNNIFLVWEKLLKKKEHIALVVDEYGGMDGIVTLEDIIETMLGLEIMDESDTISDMREYARQRWQARQEKYKFLKQ